VVVVKTKEIATEVAVVDVDLVVDQGLLADLLTDLQTIEIGHLDVLTETIMEEIGILVIILEM
jgi:hypothetical protein